VFEDFSHFLAYGSTDQETLRELSHDYQGVLVPGTIAAYQAEGTKGFILSLSAAVQKPYAIDPRTPLFQYRNSHPKQSHLALARVLGIDDLLRLHGEVPLREWSEARCEEVADRWVRFNTAYTEIAPKQFDKYARRLGRPLSVSSARLPSWVLAPYLMDGRDLECASVNDRLWAATSVAAAQVGARARRVFANRDAAAMSRAALQSELEEVLVWIDDLDETAPENSSRLSEYALAVQQLAEAGKSPFALYGGYFAIALRSVGLRGVSHGIGFSEHRNHVELRSSGGAPARFYVQRIHRYLPVEIASELWRQAPTLVDSYFDGYESRDPGEYTYHELMKLSVRARSDEAERIVGLGPAAVRAALQRDLREYVAELEDVTLSSPVERRVRSALSHLPSWIAALGAVV
jgi:hypothetical protein